MASKFRLATLDLVRAQKQAAIDGHFLPLIEAVEKALEAEREQIQERAFQASVAQGAQVDDWSARHITLDKEHPRCARFKNQLHELEATKDAREAVKALLQELLDWQPEF